MTDRKFYKTTIILDVLSEDYPVDENWDLDRIAEEGKDGMFSIFWSVQKQKELNGKEIVNELIKQGSEPEFFDINEDGDELEEE
jgi:hypothetical protein